MTKYGKTNFKAVVFDIDGTLVSTSKLIFASFNHVTKKYLGKEYPDEEIKKLFGPTEDVILKDWMKDQYKSARSDYYKFYSDNHDSMTHKIEGLRELIEDLSSSNTPLAIFTGKGRESSLITLEKLGLKSYFDLIVTGDDVANHKPDPEALQKIAEHFNIDSESILMIGDAPVDIEASRSAGCKCAAVLWDGHPMYNPDELKPDYLIDNVVELRELLFA